MLCIYIYISQLFSSIKSGNFLYTTVQLRCYLSSYKIYCILIAIQSDPSLFTRPAFQSCTMVKGVAVIQYAFSSQTSVRRSCLVGLMNKLTSGDTSHSSPVWTLVKLLVQIPFHMKSWILLHLWCDDRRGFACCPLG